jgi:hypothetical protein
MAKVNNEWRVLRHGPIEKRDDNLWTVRGSLLGMSLKRVMTVVQLEDGRLVIHSAVALDDDAMAEIEAWGRPGILLVPNAYHRLDAPAYAERYPDLKVLCPRGSRKKVEAVVRVDGHYDAFPEDPMVDLQYLDGLREVEGVMIVRSEGGSTLVFNDAIFNMPHGEGIPGFIFRHITGSTGGPRVTRLFRTLAVKDKAAFKAHLERLADTPNLTRIVVSHHRTIVDEPDAVLRRVAAAV